MCQYIHECDDCKVCTEFSSKHQRDNYKCPCKDKKPLLTIELQDETAVPKVFYKGKEITGKVRVSFDWITKGCEPNSGGTKYNIEHHETGHEDIVKKELGLRRGKYALDKQ